MSKKISIVAVALFVVLIGAYAAWSYRNSGGSDHAEVRACQDYLTANSQNPSTVVFQPVPEWSITQTGQYNWKVQAWMEDRDDSGKKVRQQFTCIASKLPDGSFEAHTIQLLSDSDN